MINKEWIPTGTSNSFREIRKIDPSNRNKGTTPINQLEGELGIILRSPEIGTVQVLPRTSALIREIKGEIRATKITEITREETDSPVILRT